MRALMALVAVLALALAVQVSAMEPQGDTGAHDPTLLTDGPHWFAFTTGRGIQRLESTDAGRTWRRLAPVFSEAPAWWADAVPEHKRLDVWAPKLFQHAGRTWVLYSISTFGKNRSAIGLASSTSPDAAEWRDDGLVVQSRTGDDFNAIDPDLMRDRDGRLWMSYGSFWGGIRLTELDATTLRPVGTTRVIARHKGGIEAPTLVRHGDWVYLFVSHDLCCRGVASTYNIRVGRARDVAGPFVDRGGVPMLDGGGTLIEAGGPRWKGPGHQDVVHDALGDVIARHAYDTEDGGKPHLRLNRLAWSADGWPGIQEE